MQRPRGAGDPRRRGEIQEIGATTTASEAAVYTYDLPPERIASRPAPERDGSRLLRVNPRLGEISDAGRFRDLPSLLRAGDLLVLNETRVMKARLRGRRASGGAVEALLLSCDAPARALVRPLSRLADGEAIDFGGFPGRLVLRHADGTVDLDFGAASMTEVMQRAGETPIPPYLKRPVAPDDERRYQTVYAASLPESSAAPTAGLHFTPGVFEALAARGVAVEKIDLAVGYGTFAPVPLDADELHAEPYRIPTEAIRAIEAARAGGGRIVAVGTTVVRALESWGATGCARGETRIFIKPGWSWRVVDALVTNFHLPGSSLLVLVHAFGGDLVLEGYRRALDLGFRFYSYGDAMFIENRS